MAGICYFVLQAHVPLRNNEKYKLMGGICYCNFIFIVLKTHWPSASLGMHVVRKKKPH